MGACQPAVGPRHRVVLAPRREVHRAMPSDSSASRERVRVVGRPSFERWLLVDPKPCDPIPPIGQQLAL